MPPDWTALPHELLAHVFAHLGAPTVFCVCRGVCRVWRDAAVETMQASRAHVLPVRIGPTRLLVLEDEDEGRSSSADEDGQRDSSSSNGSEPEDDSGRDTDEDESAIWRPTRHRRLPRPPRPPRPPRRVRVPPPERLSWDELLRRLDALRVPFSVTVPPSSESATARTLVPLALVKQRKAAAQRRASDSAAVSSPYLHGLSLAGTRLQTLAPFTAALASLRRLDLRGTAIADIAALAACTRLETLNLTGAPVADIDALRHCTVLRELLLTDTLVASLAALASCARLETLDLSGARAVGSIAPLGSCGRLRVVRMFGSAVRTLDALALCTRLEVLEVPFALALDGDRVAAALAAVESLASLTLAFSSVRRAAPLAALERLVYLDLSGTDVGDADVAALAGCAALATLRLQLTAHVTTVDALAAAPALVELDLRQSAVRELLALCATPPWVSRLRRVLLDGCAHVPLDVREVLLPALGWQAVGSGALQR